MSAKRLEQLKNLAIAGKTDEHASLRDSHAILINGSTKHIWDLLSRMEEWPDWNQMVSRMSSPKELKPGVSFSWIFNGTKYLSELQAVKKESLLSWTNSSRWIDSIFVWELERNENQTIVTISASFQGRLSVLVKSHQTIYNELLSWVECLKKCVES